MKLKVKGGVIVIIALVLAVGAGGVVFWGAKYKGAGIYPVIGAKTDTSHEILIENKTDEVFVGLTIKLSSAQDYPPDMMKRLNKLRPGDIGRTFVEPPSDTAGSGAASDDDALYDISIYLKDGGTMEVSGVDLLDYGEVTINSEDGSPAYVTYWES